MSMTKTIITKADIDAQGFYKSDSLDVDGHVVVGGHARVESGVGRTGRVDYVK